jgi:transposase
MRLNLQDINKLNSVEYFQRKLSHWCDWVPSYGKSKGYLFKPMVAAAESIISHFDGIISFANSRITNAFMEGINSVFSAVKRKARGYRSNKNLINILYFVAGKLDIHRMQRFYLHH